MSNLCKYIASRLTEKWGEKKVSDYILTTSLLLYIDACLYTSMLVFHFSDMSDL